jgi:hypothetical protein
LCDPFTRWRKRVTRPRFGQDCASHRQALMRLCRDFMPACSPLLRHGHTSLLQPSRGLLRSCCALLRPRCGLLRLGCTQFFRRYMLLSQCATPADFYRALPWHNSTLLLLCCDLLRPRSDLLRLGRDIQSIRAPGSRPGGTLRRIDAVLPRFCGHIQRGCRAFTPRR